MAIEKKTIQSSDLKEILSGKHGAELSRQIKRLVDKKMLQRIMKVLEDKGFLN